MQFTVRYWSSLLPDHHKHDGEPRWVDYSIHPATKLGLHNALLTLHDRRQILERSGSQYECAVFYLEAGKEEMLTEETAERLFGVLPHGEIHMPDIRKCMLAPQDEKGNSVAQQQLTLFEHIHTPYDDDMQVERHELDANA